MDSRLRYIIGVGFWNVSLSVATGISTGKPPASRTPRLTCSARSRRCMWQGLMPDHVLRMAMTGLPSCSSAVTPRLRIRERWLNALTLSVREAPNQRRLLSSSGVLMPGIVGCSKRLRLGFRWPSVVYGSSSRAAGTGPSDARSHRLDDGEHLTG